MHLALDLLGAAAVTLVAVVGALYASSWLTGWPVLPTLKLVCP
jgi:hypothetical protein